MVTPSVRDADAFTQWAAGPNIVPAYLIIIVGTAVGTFGYSGLWPSLGTRLGVWGAALAALGNQFLMALLGILISFHAFASTGAQTGVAAAAQDFGGAAGGVLEGLTALNFIGSIVLAIALWRSAMRRRWSGIPLAIAAFSAGFSSLFDLRTDWLRAVGARWCADRVEQCCGGVRPARSTCCRDLTEI